MKGQKKKTTTRDPITNMAHKHEKCPAQQCCKAKDYYSSFLREILERCLSSAFFHLTIKKQRETRVFTWKQKPSARVKSNHSKVWKRKKKKMVSRMKLPTNQYNDCNEKKWPRPESWQENPMRIKIVLSCKALPVTAEYPIEILSKIHTSHYEETLPK